MIDVTLDFPVIAHLIKEAVRDSRMCTVAAATLEFESRDFNPDLLAIAEGYLADSPSGSVTMERELESYPEPIRDIIEAIFIAAM